MTKSRSAKPDVIGPWSEDKLALLAKYLLAYSRIMNRQKKKGNFRKYHYVDAFAGAVTAIAKKYDPDQQITRYIDGSPLRALQTDPPFDVCWFIDMSSARSKKLADLQRENPNRDIRVVQGDCNTVIREQVLKEIAYSAHRQHGVVFLDPYGLQVRWETMKQLAETHKFDVLINFPIMGITRTLERDLIPDKARRDKIDLIMGDSDWIDALYTESSSFVSAPIVERGVIRATWLADQYALRVGRLFRYVSEPPLLMRNTRNSPIYSLFLASHNHTAVEKIFNDVTRTYLRQKSEQGIEAVIATAARRKAIQPDPQQACFPFSDQTD